MIFISYRRSDPQSQVALIANALTDEYGEDAVFVDDQIELGQPWPARLRRELDERRVVLALVGRNWNPERLRDCDDWVRKELLAGLHKGPEQIIVLLLDGAKLPAASDLPHDCDLPELLTRQAAQFRFMPRRDYDADFKALCTRLKKLCPNLGLRSITVACVRVLRSFLGTPDVRERVLWDAFEQCDMELACLPVGGGTLENLSQTLRGLDRRGTGSEQCPWPLLRYLEAAKGHCEPVRQPELTQLQLDWLKSHHPAGEFAELLTGLAAALGAHADCPRPELEADFRACTPGGGSGLPDPLKTPRAYAAVLAGRQLGGDPGESVGFPLLDFARRLRERFPERHPALERWDQEARDFFVDYYGVRPLIVDTRPPPPDVPPGVDVDAWLVVLVRPTRPGAAEYAVRGWLFHPGAPAGEALRGEGPPARGGDFPARLRDLWKHAAHVRDGAPFQVELVVPPALRNLPFGDWMADLPGPDGRKNPVVVRCLRRIADRAALDRLRRRWECARQLPDGAPLTDELNPQSRGVFRVPADFRAEELRNGLARCPGVVGVVFARPAAECRRAIDAAVEAGVPLVAWCRPACHEDPTPLIRSADPAALARALSARPSAGARGGFVVLLDDPGRLPPDLDPANRFRPPTRTDRHE